MVIFDVSTNDLDKRWVDATKLAGDLFPLDRRCVAEFDVQTVRFLPSAARFRARTPDFSSKVEIFNIIVQRPSARSAKTGVNMAVVKHQCLFIILPYLLCDGVGEGTVI